MTVNPVVGKALQQSLVDLIALELQAKQAHWNVRGPQFRALHLALDEVVVAAREQLDEVAERLGQIGGAPDGRPATVARDTVLDEIDDGFIQTDKGYQLMAEKVQKVADGLKAAIDTADEQGDAVTADLLTTATGALDLQAWFLRSATE